MVKVVLGLGEVSASETCPINPGTRQVGAVELGPIELGSAKIRAI
jgi:hypothetical protein